MSARVLILGGGIAGLISALLIKNNNEDVRVTLVEASGGLGGLLKSFSYPGYGSFDRGTHYLMESGIAELDELFEKALPHEQRHSMSGYATDVSGIYYKGRLQKNTPFPDLREDNNWSVYVSEVLKKLPESTRVKPEECANALDYFEKRFGKRVAVDVIEPIIKKLFDSELEKMSFLGTRFVPLNRIALFDTGLMQDLLGTEHCSKVLAFTEQRELPLSKQPVLQAFYPRKPGIGRVIDNMASMLNEAGVEVLLNTSVSKLNFENRHITSASLSSKGIGTVLDVECDVVINAGGVLAAAKLFELDSITKMDKPFTTVIVNFIFKEPLDTDGLYYFYCYDERFHTFRVTDYRNYCPGANIGKNFPITMEIIIKGNCPEKEDLSKLALEELRGMGLISSTDLPEFTAVEILDYGFPLLTTNNIDILSSMRSSLSALHLDNYIQCGALSDANVYFQQEVLIDTYTKISALRSRFGAAK